MIPLDWVRSQIAMAGERVGGMVLHSHSCDTPSMLPDLVTGAPVLGWGGELELVMAEQASAYFSWSQIDDEGQFGLTAAREPFNRPLATDRLTMTNYEPWWCLVGSRLSETTAYVLPHSGEKFANVLRQVFDTETGRETLWVWTGTPDGVEAVDEIVVSLNVPPSDLVKLYPLEAEQ